MSDTTSETTSTTEEETVCYRHPDTPTKLGCSRCGRPICGRCATPASVGQHCPECIADARKSAPKVKSVVRAKAPAVMTIIGICVVVYILQLLSDRGVLGDSLAGQMDITSRFGSQSIAIAIGGEWYRLLTAMFLHAPDSLFHIGFNMIVLFMYGPTVEQTFGTPRFVGLYVVCGFFASATSMLMGSELALGVGASGAIFGIVGVLLVYTYNRRTSAFVAAYQRNILFFIAINLVFGAVVARIDNWAHIGGLVAGVALGFAFDRPGKRSPAALELAATVAVIGLGVAMVLAKSATLT